MSDRSYSSINTIKDFFVNEIAPKYFDADVMSHLNIGVFGYLNDLQASTTEDVFNTITTYINEMFPNRARIPESIYSYAAIFETANLFARPAETSMLLLINEADIINYGEDKLDHIEFVLDSDMIIDVQDKLFMLDYDIKIQARDYKGDYIFNAFYNLSFNNSLSDVINPYVRIKRLNYNTEKYLVLMVKVRQVNKTTFSDSIISNDKINIPSVSFNFTDKIANFEVFYRENPSQEYVQLTKKMLYTSPLYDPFCFYKFKSDTEIEISFSQKEKYFQPTFNSEIYIKIYTTLGAAGNFTIFKGDAVIQPKSEVYQYNNNLIVLGSVQSESVFGTDNITLTDLKRIIVEKFSTVDSYSTENDLSLYFSNFKYRNNNEVMFMKKRDDVFERLFSAFILFKNSYNEPYETNTLNFQIPPTEFDHEYEQSNSYILKPGHLFIYKPLSLDDVTMVPGSSFIYNTDLDTIVEPFIYTNPFLITVTKSPSIVNYYINSVEYSLLLNYTYVNVGSIMQFICNKLYIKRNTLLGENEYVLTLELLPTVDLIDDPIVDDLGNDLGVLKIKGFIEINNIEECYADFDFVSYDATTKLYKYEARLETDDYITATNRIRILNTKTLPTEAVEIHYPSMDNCKINIKTFFKYSTPPAVITHPYTALEDLNLFVMTNGYDADDERVTFLKDLNIIKSTNTYIDTGGGSFEHRIASVPFVSARSMVEAESYSEFITALMNNYNYLQDAVIKLTNNYGIDMKFFNTYGKSKNFIVGDTGDQLLDTVNCKISFTIKPNISVDEVALSESIKIFIKQYIENNLNLGGTQTNHLYISNLIKELETNFTGIRYLKFQNINDYGPDIQVILNKTEDFNILTPAEKRSFIPEYLTIRIEDISITVLTD